MGEDWERHARETLSPKVRDAHIVVTLVPSGEPDPKIMLETGYAVWHNKPIVAVVRTGDHLPPGIERIATSIVMLESPLGTEAGQAQLESALRELMQTREDEEFDDLPLEDS